MKRIVAFLQSDLFILAIGKIVQMLLLFLAVRLFTTYLPDAEVGNLILILAVTMFLGLALVNPVGSYINRELNNWVDEKVLLQKFIVFNLYVIFVSVFAFTLPYLLTPFGVGQSINTLYFSIVVSLFVFFNTWNQTIIPALNLLFYRKAFVLFTILSISLYLSFAVSFVYFIDQTASWWLAGQVTGLAIGFGFAFLFLFIKVLIGHEKVKFRFNTDGLGKVLKFSLPLALATAMLWTLSNSYKLVIEGHLGTEALAYIGLALMLATSLSGSLESLVMQVFHSPFYKGISGVASIEQRSQVFQTFLNGTLPLISGAIFLLVCLAPFLLKILADQRFSVIYPFLMLGFGIEFLRVSTNIISHAAHSEYQTHISIAPYAIGALVSIVGIVYFLEHENWQYYVIASLFLGWLLTFSLMVFNTRKLFYFKLPVVQITKVLVQLLPVGIVTWFFWESSKSMVDSIIIIFITSLYTSMVLYKQYQRAI